MRRFKLLTIAERELFDSARFYNRKVPELGIVWSMIFFL
jgi:hypothetical protein